MIQCPYCLKLGHFHGITKPSWFKNKRELRGHLSGCPCYAEFKKMNGFTGKCTTALRNGYKNRTGYVDKKALWYKLEQCDPERYNSERCQPPVEVGEE